MEKKSGSKHLSAKSVKGKPKSFHHSAKSYTFHHPSHTEVEIRSSSVVNHHHPKSHTDIKITSSIKSKGFNKIKHGHIHHKKGLRSILNNIFRALAVGGSDGRKYVDGITQFFGTLGKDAIGAFINFFGDAGIGGTQVVGTALGISGIRKKFPHMISKIKNGLIHAGDGIVNDAEGIITNLLGTGGNLIDKVTDGIDKSDRTVGSSYYSAFSSNTGKYLKPQSKKKL